MEKVKYDAYLKISSSHKKQILSTKKLNLSESASFILSFFFVLNQISTQRMKKIVLFLFLIPSFGFAQSVIKGKIMDKKGEALPGTIFFILCLEI